MVYKTGSEIIYEILLSLNRGDSGEVRDRVNHAMFQYKQLVDLGVAPAPKAESSPYFSSNWTDGQMRARLD